MRCRLRGVTQLRLPRPRRCAVLLVVTAARHHIYVPAACWTAHARCLPHAHAALCAGAPCAYLMAMLSGMYGAVRSIASLQYNHLTGTCALVGRQGGKGLGSVTPTIVLLAYYPGWLLPPPSTAVPLHNAAYLYQHLTMFTM